MDGTKIGSRACEIFQEFVCNLTLFCEPYYGAQDIILIIISAFFKLNAFKLHHQVEISRLAMCELYVNPSANISEYFHDSAFNEFD